MFGTFTISPGRASADFAPQGPSRRSASNRRERSRAPKPVGQFKARYEPSLTTDDSVKHWSLADFLSARAANSREVRRTLRMRARYEAQNNPIFNGMINTLANDIIGKGPTLQTQFDNDDDNRLFEDRWRSWMTEVTLVRRLRSGIKARVVDGEFFMLKKTNPDLEDGVKFYPLDIETDQVQTVNPDMQKGYWVDGMELNNLGLPVWYHVLKRHPGDVQNVKSPFGPLENDRIHRRFVLHWFRSDRPGQVRGIPEVTPSLLVMAARRRYDRAVLTAAEWAATVSALLFTKLAPDDEDDTDLGQPWESWEVEPGMVTVLPDGYEPRQMESTQPTTTHQEYTRTMIGQEARPLCMPYNLAMADSSNLNFSSGRLDMLPWYRQVDIDRQDCDEVLVEPIFASWYEEGCLVPGYFPERIKAAYPTAAAIPHTFHWPPMDSLDPVKDSVADEKNLANGTTSEQRICARDGVDYREILRDKANKKVLEREIGEELGLDPDWNDPKPPPPGAAPPAAQEDDDEPNPGDDTPLEPQPVKRRRRKAVAA